MGAIRGRRPQSAPAHALQNVSTTSGATRTQTAFQSQKPPTQPENASIECDAKERATYVGVATFNLRWALDELGERERAEMLAEENLVRARSIGSTNLEAGSLESLARYADDDGRYDDALSLKREALRLNFELGDTQHVLDGLGRIADTHTHAARGRLAAQLLSASLALHEEAGLVVALYQRRRNEEMLVLLHEQLDEEAFDEAWEQGTTLTLDEAVALALGEAVTDA
jgi:tetratricopeptide (TPR) repeat protein